MHSLTIQPSNDPTGLGLFLSSGVTFEKYKFGGWGSGKIFPEVLQKRGQLGFFCDSWNKTCTASIDPSILLSPERKNNGSIRKLISDLNTRYKIINPQLIPLQSAPIIPNTMIKKNRVTLSLDLGVGKQMRRKIEELRSHSSIESLLNYLNTARIWSAKIDTRRDEMAATPGHGYCGFISMDRIINGMNRTLSPQNESGVNQILEIIRVISNSSTLPLRNNWREITRSLQSAKEHLAATAQHLRRNISDWLSLKYLPDDLWLNGGILVNSCEKWNYSRWYSKRDSNELLLEESPFRLSCRLSLTELDSVMNGKMLCFDENSRHFYTRHQSLSADFLEAKLEALAELTTAIDLSTHSTSNALTSSPDNDGVEHCTPVSTWDGLLTAELLLRPNNDHRLLDLTETDDRSKMASAIRNMNFLDLHDSHSISQHLEEFPPGIIPLAPKMSIDDMKLVCQQTDATFVVTDNKDNRTFITEGKGVTVHFNSDTSRFYLEAAEPPTVSKTAAVGSPLVAISWNSNSWDIHKSQKIAALADSSKADVILITDTRIDSWRVKAVVDNFSKLLQKLTGKIWTGEASPKHDIHRVGGNLIMHSNKITRPKITHLMPLGVLSSLDGKWKSQDFSFLSIYRPPIEGSDTSVRSLVTSALHSDMEKVL